MTEGKKTALVITGLVGFIAIMLIFFSDHGPSPDTKTKDRLRALETATIDFADKNGALPKTLQELNLEDEAISDPSGKPFLYKVDGNSATISSLGSDGRPGGVAFNADKSLTFEWKAK